MADTCVVTVVSGDKYQYYIPPFVYSALRSDPDVDVLVLLVGHLNDTVKQALELIPSDSGGRWRVLEGQFEDILSTDFSCNCLRYLVPQELLSGYKYAYITDVDFVMLKHVVPLRVYFKGIIKRTKLPIATFRSAIKRFWRPEIHGEGGWIGKYKRMVGGTTMIRIADWYKQTADIRKLYLLCAKTGKSDGVDEHHWASYREYDEVMLCRMCARAGIQTSGKRRRFVDGTRYNHEYRDVHLGDFKWNMAKSKRRFDANVTKTSVADFGELWKEEAWRKIVKICAHKSSGFKKVINVARKLTGAK
jgi:hypothetical protein